VAAFGGKAETWRRLLEVHYGEIGARSTQNTEQLFKLWLVNGDPSRSANWGRPSLVTGLTRHRDYRANAHARDLKFSPSTGRIRKQ
jgi:hypothetical protein